MDVLPTFSKIGRRLCVANEEESYHREYRGAVVRVLTVERLVSAEPIRCWILFGVMHV